MMEYQDNDSDKSISRLTIMLTKGVVYKEDDLRTWDELSVLQHHVNSAVRVLGLRLNMDQGNGFAYLKTLDELEDEDQLRLVTRRAIPFKESLLLALLRNYVAESETSEGGSKFSITFNEIAEMMRGYFPAKSNEAATNKRIRGVINNVIDTGLITRVANRDDLFRIRSVIKAFITADKLAEILASYQECASRETSENQELEFEEDKS